MSRRSRSRETDRRTRTRPDADHYQRGSALPGLRMPRGSSDSCVLGVNARVASRNMNSARKLLFRLHALKNPLPGDSVDVSQNAIGEYQGSPLSKA